MREYFSFLFIALLTIWTNTSAQITNTESFDGTTFPITGPGPHGIYFIGIKPIGNNTTSECKLHQNYPNPFNPVTKIKFDVPTPLNPPEVGTSGMVSLKIYDVLGREVAGLVNQHLKPGAYEVEWNGSNSTSGVYFYKLITGDYVETRKMILIK